MFVPSSSRCVDKSMSRWYGLGGERIDIGLLIYIAIDWKPENGCEIRDAAFGKSGIMILLILVKTAVENEATASLMMRMGPCMEPKWSLHWYLVWPI